MNRKQFILLIVLVVVLGFAGLHIYNKQQNLVGEGNPAIGQKLLGEVPQGQLNFAAIAQFLHFRDLLTGLTDFLVTAVVIFFVGVFGAAG